MTEKAEKLKHELETLNPRYEGATPEMVARALLRHEPQAEDGEAEAEPSGIMDQPVIQSDI